MFPGMCARGGGESSYLPKLLCRYLWPVSGPHSRGAGMNLKKDILAMFPLNSEYLCVLRGQGCKGLRMVVLWQHQASCSPCSCPCPTLLLRSLSLASSILAFLATALSEVGGQSNTHREGQLPWLHHVNCCSVSLFLGTCYGCLPNVLFKLSRK